MEPTNITTLAELRAYVLKKAQTDKEKPIQGCKGAALFLQGRDSLRNPPEILSQVHIRLFLSSEKNIEAKSVQKIAEKLRDFKRLESVIKSKKMLEAIFSTPLDSDETLLSILKEVVVEIENSKPTPAQP